MGVEADGGGAQDWGCTHRPGKRLHRRLVHTSTRRAESLPVRDRRNQSFGTHLEEGNLQQRRVMETEFRILDKEYNLDLLTSSSSSSAFFTPKLAACAAVVVTANSTAKEAAEDCQNAKFSLSGFIHSFLSPSSQENFLGSCVPRSAIWCEEIDG